MRGVGNVDAKSKIQIDRYTAVSKEGATNSFINDANTFEGWKITLTGKDAWVQFDRVDFGNGNLKSVNVRSASSSGGSVEIHLDKADGPLLAKVEIRNGSNWKVFNSKLASAPTGMHNLVVTQNGSATVDLDWVSFE